MSNLNSYIIWYADNRYSIAWGVSPEDAKAKYLANWEKSIALVESTAKYRNPLPLDRQVPIAGACSWGDEPVPPTIHEPIPATPAPETPKADLAAEVAELKALVLSLTKGKVGYIDLAVKDAE
jgi:hypothetical protein